VTDVTADWRRSVHKGATKGFQVLAMSLPLRIVAFLVLSAASSAVLALPYLNIQ
jgi:hypothetical protein